MERIHREPEAFREKKITSSTAARVGCPAASMSSVVNTLCGGLRPVGLLAPVYSRPTQTQARAFELLGVTPDRTQ